MLLFGVVPIVSLGHNKMQISNGYHFAWMIALYMIGGYFQMYGKSTHTKLFTFNRNWYLLAFLLMASLQLLYQYSAEYITIRFLGGARFADLFLTYNSPLILGEAICLFLYATCDTITPTGKKRWSSLISRLTPGVYSVYIIHTHPLIWNYVLKNLFAKIAVSGILPVTGVIMLTALSIFVLCIIFDIMRQKVFQLLRIYRLVDNISRFIELRISQYLKD